MQPIDPATPPPKTPAAEQLLQAILVELQKQTVLLAALRDGLVSK